MVFYEYDVLDDKYDVDRFRVYYENVEITTAEEVYEAVSCCLHTRHEIYGLTLTNGTEIEIPSADVITFKGIECGA